MPCGLRFPVTAAFCPHATTICYYGGCRFYSYATWRITYTCAFPAHGPLPGLLGSVGFIHRLTPYAASYLYLFFGFAAFPGPLRYARSRLPAACYAHPTHAHRLPHTTTHCRPYPSGFPDYQLGCPFPLPPPLPQFGPLLRPVDPPQLPDYSLRLTGTRTDTATVRSGPHYFILPVI